MQVVTNEVLGKVSDLVTDTTIPEGLCELLRLGGRRRANGGFDEAVLIIKM